MIVSMSIIWTLRKFVDAIEHREQEAAQERDRRAARRQALGEGDDGVAPAPAASTRLHRCRVCGHEAQGPAFCPVCLADTMVAVEPEDGESGAPP